MLKLSSKTEKIIYTILASVIVHFIWRNTSAVIDFLDISRTTALGQSIRALLLTLSVFIFTAIVIKPKEIFSFLGLDKNILKGLGIALLCVLPLFIIFLVFGSFNTNISFFMIYHKCIIAGFTEELVCRAFMFGLLFRYAKTGFFWAVVLPALYFGSLHLYQGHDVMSALAAFGVTFIGALYFSWMYAEWNFNLWVPIGLHILMNLAWFISNMEGTEVAAGGLISNIARVLSILLAVVITIWYKRRNKSVMLYHLVFLIYSSFRHNGRYHILPAFDWLDNIPRIGRHLPFAPDFTDVAFEKFIICDNLYQGYLATQRDDLLAQLASILYQSAIPGMRCEVPKGHLVSAYEARNPGDIGKDKIHQCHK